MAQQTFEAEQVAYFEAAGWRAYYNRDWPRVLGLMIQLNREQFGMSWPSAMLASVDVVRASVAFAPVDNDIPAATKHLTNYYAKARRAAGIRAGAEELAGLEMDYWVIHRRLANERKAAPDHKGDLTPMVDALTALHEALFDVTPEIARRSAELRAQAAARVDRITGGYSEDMEADWLKIETDLQEAYRAIGQDGPLSSQK
ncbi:MAG: hypothetical protein WBO46_00590 [Caldilineaceae bacterium]